MPTLLEKAMKVPKAKIRRIGGCGGLSKFTLEERLDTAIAYARHEIDGAQAGEALRATGNNISASLGSALLTAARRGLITIKKV